MRVITDADGITVRAIAGTYVVILAIDASAQARKGLLGFAIRRTDKTENESYWLQGMRTFESVYPNPPEGALVTTHEHPVQDFLWSDFTAKEEHEYVYEVIPVRGIPKNLEYGKTVSITVNTESAHDGTHGVYFNRGVIGSQAYAREFNNADPQTLTGAEKERAYAWLSRGLWEAMSDFISAANKPGLGLRAAVYEFDYEPAIALFGKVLTECQDVKIIYDARIKQTKGEPDEKQTKRVANVRKMLKKYGLAGKDVSIPRRSSPSYIAHNKFIVLLDNDKPVAVWTGSTNFTESGIFGQSNVGHVVRDPAVARQYMQFWERLSEDPEVVPDLRNSNEDANPDIETFPPPNGITPVFSPRHKNDQKETMLNWYASAIGEAKTIMCLTEAFGINELFMDVLSQPIKKDDFLRYLFLEKWALRRADYQATQDALKQNANNLPAVGSYLQGDVLHEYLMDRWKEERSNSLSTNVRYTHSKYMLIDPLSENPIIISGSANFSDASTVNNDENMLVIAGDTRVADIYLGEFMRLWRHYRFRSIVGVDKDDNYKPNYLDETDEWTNHFYTEGRFEYKRRLAFMADSAKDKHQ